MSAETLSTLKDLHDLSIGLSDASTNLRTEHMKNGGGDFSNSLAYVNDLTNNVAKVLNTIDILCEQGVLFHEDIDSARMAYFKEV